MGGVGGGDLEVPKAAERKTGPSLPLFPPYVAVHQLIHFFYLLTDLFVLKFFVSITDRKFKRHTTTLMVLDNLKNGIFAI